MKLYQARLYDNSLVEPRTGPELKDWAIFHQLEFVCSVMRPTTFTVERVDLKPLNDHEIDSLMMNGKHVRDLQKQEREKLHNITH